jgi:hypothetical protein
MNWKVYHLDVKIAFLNGHLKETIYMTIPQGFKTKENQGLVCLLKQALYGLKQVSKSWYSRIDSTLLQMHMVKSLADYNMYIYKRENMLMICSLRVTAKLKFFTSNKN